MLKSCIAITLALSALLAAGEVDLPIPISDFKLNAKVSKANQLVAKYDLCGNVPSSGMFVVPALGFDSAGDVCRKFGGHLARIDNENFLEATIVAFQCSGPFSETWIRSWNTDSYQRSCLVLSTGVAPRGGAINRPAVCATPRKALCQIGLLPELPDTEVCDDQFRIFLGRVWQFLPVQVRRLVLTPVSGPPYNDLSEIPTEAERERILLRVWLYLPVKVKEMTLSVSTDLALQNPCSFRM